MSEPKVGEYWMHRGTAVLVSDQNEYGRYGITFVQIVESDGTPRVICGGHSFSYPASEFHPITDPYLKAATRIFAAQQAARDFEVKKARAEADRIKWEGVLEVLFEARQQQSEESKL